MQPIQWPPETNPISTDTPEINAPSISEPRQMQPIQWPAAHTNISSSSGTKSSPIHSIEQRRQMQPIQWPPPEHQNIPLSSDRPAINSPMQQRLMKPIHWLQWSSVGSTLPLSPNRDSMPSSSTPYQRSTTSSSLAISTPNYSFIKALEYSHSFFKDR